MRELHTKPYLGHLGYQKTLTAIKRRYYWLNLKKEVANFTKNMLGMPASEDRTQDYYNPSPFWNGSGINIYGFHHGITQNEEAR